MHRFTGWFVAIAFLALDVSSQISAQDGYVPLFNGKDLSGWVNVNCGPKTFAVKGDEIVTTGTPTGFLSTEKQYENFIMEVEWMHVEKTKMANSGIFVWGDPLPAIGSQYTRGIEVQVLLNYKPADGWATSQGDIFSIWGAKCIPDRPHPKGLERCLPSEDRTKGAGEWNHYKIIAQDGVIKLHVNGKEVSGVRECNPRKGYLALESEGVECHFRNIKIKEMPSTNPTKEQTATLAIGHKSLFDGQTMHGWTAENEGWTAGGSLRSNGKGDLVLDRKVTSGELIFDWKVPAKSKSDLAVQLGTNHKYTYKSPGTESAGKWTRVTMAFGKDGVSQSVNGQLAFKSGHVPDEGPITFKAAEGLELMNLFYLPTK